MATTSKLRKMLHRKSAEYCAQSAAGNTASGAFVVSDKSNMIPSHDIAYYVGGVSAIWNYNADNDAWLQIPSSGVAGTFAAGACGEFRALSAPAGTFDKTATAGSTTTITTNLTITRDCSGYEIHVVGGSGVGYVGTITNVVMGANSILTVTPASAVAFDATTVYRIYGGSLWFMNAGTAAVGFSVYDRITNAWTSRSVTGLPTAWGTDAQLVSTSGRMSNNGAGFVTGTASSGTSTTIVDATRTTWLNNMWVNYQVRITGGTGKGQIRVITASTTTGTITVGTAWTVTPDATSTYRIEGNDDVFYLLGNNAVTMYKFTVSTNTWATIAPTVARGGALGAGGTADWIDGVTSTVWQDQNVFGLLYTNTIYEQNGRYIYSFRGAASSTLDVYDIAANTWINDVQYGQKMETFTTGSCSIDLDGNIYIQKEATGRIYRFDVAKNVLEPYVWNPNPQGTAVAGDKMFITTYSDGGDKINFLYTLPHTRAELVRWVMI